jgi:hypothetical protein
LMYNSESQYDVAKSLGRVDSNTDQRGQSVK